MKKFNYLSKGLLFSYLLFITSFQLKGSIIEVKDTVNTNTTWDSDTVNVTGDIVISSGNTLTIDTGTFVQFMGYYSITVEGTLIAIGNTDDTIVFTVNDTNNFSNFTIGDGGWAGLRINSTCQLMYCKFENSKRIQNGYPDSEGGAIYTFSSSVTIKKCHFYHNYAKVGGAISFRSDVTMEECLVDYNIAGEGGGGLFSPGTKVTLIGNTITNNTAQYGGGVAFNGGADFRFFNNTISLNKATSSGGGVSSESSVCYFENNFITNNSAATNGGGCTFSSSFPSFINNIIANNAGSSAIFSFGSDVRLISNTIYNNNGYGVQLASSNMQSLNNIYYGNKTYQISISDKISIATIKYCNIESDSSGVYTSGGVFLGFYENNISNNPAIVTPTIDNALDKNALLADWSLQPSSTCINNGTPDTLLLDIPDKDIYDNTRIRNHVIDIGATEKYIDIISVSGNLTKDTTWFADTVKVTGNFTVNDGYTLTINPGTIVQMQGNYSFTVLGRLIAEGATNDSIKFTCLPDSIASGWQGFIFDNSSGELSDNDTTLISHCIIEYAKKTSDDGSGITIKYFSKLIISNTTFRYNQAVYKGGGIHCYYSSPLIINNFFYHNIAERGGGISLDRSSPNIINNIFYMNQATEGGGLGGGIFGWFSNSIISGNIISKNTGNGIKFFADNTKESYFTNNLIIGNTPYGISISDIKFFASNNTITGNQYSGMSLYSCNGTVINSLFYDDNISIDGSASINISNCNLTKGMSDISGSPTVQNIYNYNPEFENYNTDIKSFEEAKGLSMLNTSLSINKGLNNYSYYSIPSFDLLKNKRINDTIIDIGAIENQGDKPVFILQPGGSALCEGDTFTLSVSTDKVAFYQWQKDGTNIPGATSANCTISSVSENNEGNYICVASNAYGKTYSNPAFIKVRIAPEITEEPSSMLVHKNSPVLLQVKADGTRPLSYHWIKDGIELPDTTPKLYIDSFRLVNEGKYLCNVTNSCGSVYTDSAIISLAPSICLVTVYTKDKNAKGHNLIVWDKESKINYSKYKIYRESAVAGYYDNIGNVLSDNPGVFEDTTVNPKEQAYLYKITAVGSNNAETDISSGQIHKTIHLLTTKGEQGGIQLDWDQYIGFPYSTYYIYRSTNGTDFELAHAMASSTRTWTDDTVATDTLYYYVAVQKADSCHPSGKKMKAGGGTYGQSVSNMEDNRLRMTNIKRAAVDQFSFNIYPNPYSDYTTISYRLKETSDVTLEIYNLLGEKSATLVNARQNAGYYNLRCNAKEMGISSGIYLAKLKAGDKFLILRLWQTK